MEVFFLFQTFCPSRIWNLTRFHPFWALLEMTMGIVACRDVMLDTEEDKKKKKKPAQLDCTAVAN